MSYRFNTILLGTNTPVSDPGVYKYALLRAQLSVLIVLVAVINMVLDVHNQVVVFFPLNISLIVFSGVSLLLTRLGYYWISTLLLLLTMNATVFLFADAHHPGGGVYFYFICSALTALVLFGHRHRQAGIGFAALSLALGILTFFLDLGILDSPEYQPGAVERNFIVNFTICTVCSSVVIYFLIKRNHESERALVESAEQLKKTSLDLEESQQRFALALRGTRAGIYEWKVITNEIFVSPAYKNLLGYSDHELLEITPQFYLREIIHPDDLARMRQNMEHPETVGPTYQNEVRLKTKTGGYKWFMDSGVLTRSSTGEVEMVVGSIIETDERKKAEEEIKRKNDQLAKTNLELDRFVYSASHDMRAPLSSLLGLIHLSEKTNQADELHLYLSMMKERIKTMEGFIREVTDYSRNARLDIISTEVFLRPMVLEIAQALAFSVENKSVQIVSEIPEEFVLKTDLARLQVILNNLISNAYKYHDWEKAERYIRITAERNEHDVVIEIADNGVGIAPNYQQRVFEMFFRASETSEGSGLGLYIVKETLEKLGGAITVHSVPGQGSTFSFSIPDLAHDLKNN